MVIMSVMNDIHVNSVNALRLFATTNDDNAVLYELSSVDASVNRTVGSTGLKISAIAWHPAQELIWAAVAGGNIWSIDPLTGVTSHVVALNDTKWITGLTFSSTNQLVGAFSDSTPTLNVGSDIDNPYLVHIDTTTGLCVPFTSNQFGTRTGLSYDDTDNLWFMRGQENTFDSVTAGTTGALIQGINPDSQPFVASGLTCAANDVCYVLLGDPTYNPLSSLTSGIATLDRVTGVLLEIGRTGLSSTLRGLTVEAFGVYLQTPAAATQGVLRTINVYAQPALHTPITFTFVSSSNHGVLTNSAITVIPNDASSVNIAFTSSTQGVTKVTWTAVDSRGRSVTNSLPLAILPSPVLVTPPSSVLAVVGQNGSLPLTDLHQLDGVTLAATATGDLQLWTDTTGVHWYSPSATSQAVTVTATNVYGGVNTVTFTVNSVASSVPCLTL